MRRILDENDVLTAEQAQEFDRREADLDAANETVARLEKIEGIAPAPKFAEARSIALGDDDPVSIDEGVEVSEKRDADQAFSDWLRSRGTDAEARSTMVTSAIANNRGSQWVPQNWSNQLIQSLVLQTALFDVSQVLETEDGTTLNLPASTADEATALECAKAASNNRDIMMQRGYDFGYCWPSTVKLVDVAPEGRTELVGLWEVCLP
jgi:HK97 family phage major capsid protein